MFKNLIFLFICTIFPTMLYASEEAGNIREAAVAGRFYPGTETELRKNINSLLSKAILETLPDRPIALISPHAGYQYSGEVAAYGYNAIKGHNYKRVVILAPTHQFSRNVAGASILDVEYYRTPLGLVKLDIGVCNNLLMNPPYIGTFKKAHNREHSLETQLPFLQVVLKDIEIVPILIGRLNSEVADFLAEKIKPFIDKDTLIIASCDFTHYGYGYSYVPFKKDVEANVRKLDYGAFERIMALDFDGFLRYKKATRINACGFGPVALLIKLLPDEAKGKILKYDTSGNITGDFNSSVSYASIVFTNGKNLVGSNEEDTNLNEEEKSTLLKIARDTLESYTQDQSLPNIKSGKYNLTDKLQGKRGVFVTLNKNGNLRGCIGHIIPREQLVNAVIQNTINSSTNDRRFNPVSKNELQDIDIDISVLSPIKKVDGPEKFIPGEHGVIIRMGGMSAVFLPQVATEQGWDREETLSHLCRKAGLPMSAWKDSDMEYFIFTAQVFHEQEKVASITR